MLQNVTLTTASIDNEHITYFDYYDFYEHHLQIITKPIGATCLGKDDYLITLIVINDFVKIKQNVFCLK